MNVPVSTLSFPEPPEAMHGAERAWDERLLVLSQWLESRGVSPARALVLVPYAQLMATARQAWARTHPNGFAPRFESSRNWAANLMPFAPGPTDWSGDMARDSLVASAFVDRVVKGRADAALRSAMASRLVEATRSLAPIAAAVSPEQRSAWGLARQEALAAGLHNPAWEGLIATLAITWASNSAYATDVLWGPLAAPGAAADALVVFQGFQQDPLASALTQYWGQERSITWVLQVPDGGEAHSGHAGAIGLHPCADAEDEAQRAAACVIRHLDAGRSPVALLANDRLLTRRVSALLHSAGVVVRDETGWKLSTTFAAAQLMALLRAADPRASMDDVIDAMKLAPAWSAEQAQTLEALARRHGISRWRAALAHTEFTPAVPPEWRDLLTGLQAPRALSAWLHELSQALTAGGWWAAFVQDAAGQQMVASLRLHPGAGTELEALGPDGAQERASNKSGPRWTLPAFTTWVVEVLEGASFTAPAQMGAPVVILPMAQQVGRAFAATVVPGCDERSLPTHPEPPAPWTEPQRQVLGLPDRETLALAAVHAWQALLPSPHLDILWRGQDRGEATLPTAWVMALQQAGAQAAADPRAEIHLETRTPERPAPSAAGLMPERLSASAYQDLRDCPYRFFALRQLRLQDTDELEGEPDQRDMGNWLHAVLRGFHEERGEQRPGRAADTGALERWAQTVSETMGLQAGDGHAGFLPYQAVWPAMREGYLDWLGEFEAMPGRAGPAFEAAEVERTAAAGRWRLLGKLDRIDAQPSPEGRLAVVIDYKTESRERTLERVKDPLEDTQLAFYAALLPEENLRAAYLSITDKRGSGRNAAALLIEQSDVLLAREALLEGLERDLDRVAAGHTMPALGEGRACEFCAARGLCRRDDWSAA
jgi:ATP-dependent helicase/nuclease subunit B